ncbi:MAG: flagellar basal body rod protein FlgB [Fimbriimonadaceae bacterium]|nr:flagellar basal body rod protein FlgB [Fimbriimonadaceae bacterium]
MLERLFGTHATNLERSLDRTTQRQSLLALNLANVNTPNYKRRDVDFGIILTEIESGPNLTIARNRLRGGVQQYNGDVRVDGNSVNMEQEVAAMAETELRYEALADMTRRYFSGLRDVIREGR